MIPFKAVRVGPFDIAFIPLRAEERDECLGQFSKVGMAIELREAYGNQQQEAETVIHEVLHAVWYIMGIHGKPEAEEAIVNRMSVGLAMVFRDNPDLIEWMKEQLK